MARTRRVSAPVRDAVRALADRRAVPDLGWISHLTGCPEPEVQKVLAEVGRWTKYAAQIRAAHLAAGRTFYAQFRAPLDLYAVVRLTRPDHVVETGVSSGVSSAYLLLALQQNRHGQLHSIDLPRAQHGAQLSPAESPVSLPPGRSSGWAIPSALTQGWDLRVGPSETLLPRLVDDLASIGLFLHDSRHTPAHLAFELCTIRPKLVPGAVVLADNTSWTGMAFDRFARSFGVRIHRRRASDLVGLRYPAESSALRRRASAPPS